MIHPFTRMVIKGALWYQGMHIYLMFNPSLKSVAGEHNAAVNRDKYTCTFSKLIEYWRRIWHVRTNFTADIQFPFGFVQVNSS